MIEVKLEDFEKYRVSLTDYAICLLNVYKSRYSKKIEEDQDSKDIVQQCYLAFHKHHKDAFVSENHLIGFLKICLYNCYREHIDLRRRRGQYNYYKANKSVDDLKNEEHPFEVTCEDLKDLTAIVKETHFRRYFTNKQLEVIDFLMEGLTQVEISDKLEISRQGVNEFVKIIQRKAKKYIKKYEKIS